MLVYTWLVCGSSRFKSNLIESRIQFRLCIWYIYNSFFKKKHFPIDNFYKKSGVVTNEEFQKTSLPLNYIGYSKYLQF